MLRQETWSFSPWPGLWRQEWRLQGRRIESLATAWLTLFVVFPLIGHPALVSALGVMHAAILAVAAVILAIAK